MIVNLSKPEDIRNYVHIIWTVILTLTNTIIILGHHQ